MKILIIGATGNIGRTIVQQLNRQGIQPRIASRDVAKAQKQFPQQSDFVAFDFHQKNTFANALNGVSKVFFIAPHDHPEASVAIFLQVAQQSDIQHIVFSSGRTTAPIQGKPLYKIERLVEASNIPYTIVRPGWFMQNFTGWIGGESIAAEGKFYLPAADSKTAFIDVRDIAAVVIRILIEKNHAGKIYNLTSDEALTHHEVAQKIACVLHQPVQYVPLSDEAFIDYKLTQGWDLATAKHTVQLYQIVRKGKEAKISPDVQQILRRLPISFDEFVEAYYSGKEVSI